MKHSIEITTKVGCSNVCEYCPQSTLIKRYRERIGKDEDGTEICRFLKDADIGTVHLQKDSVYKTGSVSISLDNEGSASYSIDFPSAWDYIAYNKKIDMELSLADAFIYGSLAARNNTTQKTLLQLLEKATFKVFDVNLRAPYYTKELLLTLMKKADFIKFNEEVKG